MKKKIALLMAMVMLFAVTTAGTLAWLQAETDPVVNTFTVGNINITLDEADVDDTDEDGNVTERDKANEYKMIPGQTYTKDPIVTVKADSEDCYLFVKVIELNNTLPGTTDKVIEWTMLETGWTYDATNDVYHRNVALSDTDTPFNLITGDTIKISESLTKDILEADGFVAPTLTFKACAVQSANVEYSDAVSQALTLMA